MRTLPIVLAALTLSACDDVVEEAYETRLQADAAGATVRGWIPAFVPVPAYDLHDIHNLDTNAQTLTFAVPPADIPAMLASAGLVRIDGFTPEQAASLGWRDPVMENLEAYVFCNDFRGSGALLVNRKTGRAVFNAPAESLIEYCG